MKIVEHDKAAILDKLRNNDLQPGPSESSARPVSMSKGDGQEWTTFPDEEITFFYAGLVPWMVSIALLDF